MTSNTLNTDVLSHILSFVSSPRDLLAVSLSNNQLSSLADPELVYRSVRCRLGNDAVWEHLIANPAHASRVRELEIQRENFSGYGDLDERERAGGLDFVDADGSKVAEEELIARQSPDVEKVERSEKLLIQAIKLLVNLESFKWDRWVPLVNQGVAVWERGGIPKEGAALEVYEEDIWTALRDYTQVKRINVVDLGNQSTIVPKPYNIYDSRIFSLSNLTHVDLKIYYSPADENEGAAPINANNADDSDEEDIEITPGRVDVTRIGDLLQKCPNLEHLSLAISDAVFYHMHNGNPYTDITPIVSVSHWPRLTSLETSDVIIRDKEATEFLASHPSIRSIISHLSYADIEDDLNTVPFTLEEDTIPSLLGAGDQRRAFLPNLETLQVHPQFARGILRAVIKHRLPSASASVTSVTAIEPQHWGCSDSDGDADDNGGDSSAFDDVWGAPEKDPDAEAPIVEINLLENLPQLRSLTVKNVRTFDQLDKLVQSTPNLESLTLHESSIRGMFNHSRPYSELLPYLSRWPNLTTFLGIPLWDLDLPDMTAKETLDVASQIVAVCPSLRKVSWVDWSPVELKKDGNAVKLTPVQK